MTYCVAISVDSGIVFCSDSRTNAGIDQVSTYSKMYTFGNSGERQFVILTAGNLATTQAVISQLRKDIKLQSEPNLMITQTIRDTADYIGSINVEVQRKHKTATNRPRQTHRDNRIPIATTWRRTIPPADRSPAN